MTAQLIGSCLAAILLSGCASQPTAPAQSTVAYCKVNPADESCSGVLRRASEYGVTASPEALAKARSEAEGKEKEKHASGTKRIGRVVDAQIVKSGTPGSNVGASLGSATAQAGYIDNTLLGSGNYNAMGQVGAGVIGAMLGSALDQPARAWYEIHYWIDFGGGPKEVTLHSYSPTHIPRGACVLVHKGRVVVVDTAECEG